MAWCFNTCSDLPESLRYNERRKYPKIQDLHSTFLLLTPFVLHLSSGSRGFASLASMMFVQGHRQLGKRSERKGNGIFHTPLVLLA